MSGLTRPLSLGTHIGSGCTLSGTFLMQLIQDYDLVHIGDNVFIDQNSTISGHDMRDGCLLLGRVEIGNDCTIGYVCVCFCVCVCVFTHAQAHTYTALRRYFGDFRVFGWSMDKVEFQYILVGGPRGPRENDRRGNCCPAMVLGARVETLSQGNQPLLSCQPRLTD